MKTNTNDTFDENSRKPFEQEIGLQEIIFSLWNGKIILLVFVLLFSSVSAFRAYNKPTVYISSSELEVVNDPYSLQELNAPVYLDSIQNYLKSATFFAKVANQSIDSSSLAGLTITKKENGILSFSMSSLEKDLPYKVVKLFVDNANAGIKERELGKITLALKAIEGVNTSGLSSEIIESDFLDIKGKLLLKESLLKNSDFELLSLLVSPTTPPAEIKPNKLLSILTGGVLGFVFGTLIILGRMLIFPIKRM